MITQTYNLNLIPDRVPVIVNCSQYDANSRTIEMVIYDGSVLYTIPSGVSATVRGTKQDNTGFEYPCTIDGSIVSFDIQNQMTIFAGRVPCEIRLSNNGGIIGTCNFLLNVEETPLDPDVTISETDLPLLEEAEQNAIRAENAADRAESLLDTKMDLVSSPTANNILLTDGNGQAVDSGKALADLQDKLTAGTGISISSGTIKNEFATLSNVDLDTVTYNFSGYVYGTTNYPTGTNAAGLLISSSRIAAGTSYRGIQLYSPYNANTLYMRSYNGSWSEWIQMSSSTVLLWQNSSPTSSFASQDISLPSLANYKYVLIEFKIKASATYNTTMLIPKNGSVYVATSMNWDGTTNLLCGRGVRANTNNTVSFQVAYKFATYGTSTADNTFMVPVAIHGVN